jgi:hypothetical protein
MMSCYKATALISLSHERPLLFKERAALRVHTLICSACRNFQKNSLTLSKAMQAYTQHND